MHYYQLNIGDYHSHTSRLSLIEDIAYRRMLDVYYLTERPLSECSTDVARDIGMSEYIEEISYVLEKFFTLSDKGFINKRADAEIKHYKSKQRSASKAGKASALLRKEKAQQAFNVRSTDVQPTNNHKPITNNHKPANTNKAKRFIKPTVEEVKSYCDERGNQINPKHFVDHYDAIDWMRGKNKIKNWKAVIRTWESNNNGKQGFSTNRTVSASDRNQAAYEEELARIQAEDSTGLGTVIELETSQFSSGES